MGALERQGWSCVRRELDHLRGGDAALDRRTRARPRHGNDARADAALLGALVRRDVVIGGYAETKLVVKSGRSTYDLAGELLATLLEATGLSPQEIDGLAVSGTQSECTNPFYAAFLCDALGLEVKWLNLTGLAGCSALGGVARAMSAIRDGQCRCALVISADAPTTRFQADHGAWRDDFQAPQGVMTPPAAFGLIASRYAAEHGLDFDALGRIAVTQRGHAMLNDNACDKLRTPAQRERACAPSCRYAQARSSAYTSRPAHSRIEAPRHAQRWTSVTPEAFSAATSTSNERRATSAGS